MSVELNSTNAQKITLYKQGEDYSAMRGPCDAGFHVPLRSEWEGIKEVMRRSFYLSSSDRISYLHMPIPGYRDAFSGDVMSGIFGNFWCSDGAYGSPATIYFLQLTSSNASITGTNTPCYGYNVRPFHDGYVEPDSTRTVSYGTLGSSGIFWNQTEGLISITDGTYSYTIADKNLGATVVYNDSDTLSANNCGKFYQWGNNYGFPYSGSITTSSTQVDASTYGPGNYYSSSTFIKGNERDSSQNEDIRGGETGIRTGLQEKIMKKTTLRIPKPDYSAMRGPCDEGFHIPLHSEQVDLVDAFNDLGFTTVTEASTYLKLPAGGYLRASDGTIVYQGSNPAYWACTEADPYDSMANYIGESSATLDAAFISNKTYGRSIRPRKDFPVIPDSSWTTLYQGTGSAGIFHNTTDGLISISSDGTNWITIADKNIGATTVYNNGDTMSEANCGGFFQWGNNYMFPYTGATTTSSTAVDTTGYGPGNYYSSSTFITGSQNRSNPNNNDLWGGDTGVQQILIEKQLRPVLAKDAFYFEAKQANSTVQLTKTGSPTAVNLETSTNGFEWTDYTIGNTITLTNIGDKIYFRNKSTVHTGFSTGNGSYYQFILSGSIGAYGDITYLICKDRTTSLVTFYSFYYLFRNQTALTAAPMLPATDLQQYCYSYMFYGCTNLENLPTLPATTLKNYCYRYMFYNCSKIKLSSTQTGTYQTAYRIPITGTGTTATSAMGSMFTNTGGTFTGAPSINTTYYTSNTLV